MNYKNLTETAWEQLWLRQAEERDVDEIPPLAPDSIQKKLHGTSGATAIRGALKFRKIVNENIGSLSENARLLDFGCGWGRHIRVFLKDFYDDNIFGVDIDKNNIELCKKYLPNIKFLLSVENKPLDISDNSIDLIISFSVFSHINENSSKFWFRELERILKPGGHAVITSWGKILFDIYERVKNTGAYEYKWEENILKSFDDMEKVKDNYYNGMYQFGSHGMIDDALDADIYGIALMPSKWIEMNSILKVKNILDDPRDVPQTTFILRK